MQFDVVIGNPPYSELDGGRPGSGSALYQYFFESAQAIKPKYVCYITPSRWYSSGRGKGLKEFREFMLQSNRVSTIVDYDDCNECFDGLRIAGGGMLLGSR